MNSLYSCSSSNSFRNIILLLVFFMLVIFVRICLLEIYDIQSNSMASTLIAGDAIIIRKLQYDNRLLNLSINMYPANQHCEDHKNINIPKKNDVLVFKLPEYKLKVTDRSKFYDEYLVKRCFRGAGEYILINKDLKNFGEEPGLFTSLIYEKKANQDLLVIDTVWIPEKGLSLHLSCKNHLYYSDVIFHEGYDSNCKDDSIFIKNNYTNYYTFSESYYFMLGDNYYESMDSRFFGFVPGKNIVGKAVLVLFSLDPDAPWYRKFRWNRFLKRIE